MGGIFENRDVKLLTLGTLFQFAGIDGFQQYFAAVYQSRGQSDFAVGSLVVLYFCFWFFSQAKYAPRWVNCLKPKNALFIGALPYPFLPLAVYLNNEVLIIIGAGLVGIGAALFWVASGTVLNACSSEGEIGKNTSLQLIALYFGGMITTLMGTPFILSNNFETFSILCALSSLAGALIYLLIKSEIKMLPIGKGEKSSQLNSKYLYLSVFSAFFVAIIAVSSIKILVSQTAGPEGVTVVGNGIKLTSMMACLVAGLITDRYDPAKVLCVTSVLGLSGLLLFVSTSSLFNLTIASIFIAIFFASIRPIYLALIRSRTSQEGFSLPHAVYARYTTQGMFTGLLVSLIFSATASILLVSVTLGLSVVSIAIFLRKFPILSLNHNSE